MYYLPRQRSLSLTFGFLSFFFPRSAINVRLVSKGHASTVHRACVEWGSWAHAKNLQKFSSTSLTVGTDSIKSHTSEQTVRGRPTLKDVKRFRKGSVCKPYEKSVYERTFLVNYQESAVLYQRSYRAGL